MSAVPSTLSCTACDEKWSTSVIWGTYKYLLSEEPFEGEEIYLDRTLGWCGSCDRMQPVETLPDRFALEVQIQSLESLLDDLRPKFRLLDFLIRLWPPKRKELGQLEENLLKLQKRYSVVGRRDSPPRCLKCGATEIMEVYGYNDSAPPLTIWPDAEPPPAEPIDFVHPGCGGQVMTRSAPVRLMMRMKKKVYDIEGRLLWEEWDR